jgi:signal peptidase II
LNNRALGLGTAAAAFAAEWAAQPFLMAWPPGVIIPGLADFRPAWNRGVSFSLFTQDGDTGRYVLMAAIAAISAGVVVAMWRASSRLSSVAYGLVLGGALGNLADRVRFDGAVFDFLFLHLGTMPLFVCNLPDIVISAGVVLLFVEAFLDHTKPAPES